MALTITPLKDLDIAFGTDPAPIYVRGWIESITTTKKTSFIILRDGVGQSGRIQVCFSTELAKDLAIESYVLVSGRLTVIPGKQHSFRPFEIQATCITVLGSSDSEVTTRCPPGAGPEVKLRERHIYARDPAFGLVTKLREVLVRAIRKHFHRTDCTEIFPPSFVGNQCEGGATLFKLDYPDKDKGEIPAYLTQSSQFYLEYVLPGIGDCFCIAPSFRAERSQTRRHLTEFLHAESEWSGIFTLEDHIGKLKAMLKDIVTDFLGYGGDYLKQLVVTPDKTLRYFPGRTTLAEGEEPLDYRLIRLIKMTEDTMVMTHREAVDYCRQHKIYKDAETQTDFDYTDDIPEAQERLVIDQIGKIVFLTRFPTIQKSFYMERASDDPDVVLGVDIEAPGVGEVVGSGVRVHQAEELRSRLKEQGLKEEEYKEYIDLRKYGAGHTSGMGLGVDRMLTWLLGVHSIRDVVTFPRVPGLLTP